VGFPSIAIAEGLSNAVLGSVLTKILYPFVDRIGLTPPQAVAVPNVTLSPVSMRD
jgi:hypothetical protein